MRKCLRLRSILLLVAITFLATLSGTFSIRANRKAFAEGNEMPTEYTFTMENGASVMLLQDGMRFVVKMDKGLYDYVVTNDTKNEVTLSVWVAPLSFFEATKVSEEYHPENLSNKANISFAEYEDKIYQKGEYYYANGCMGNLGKYSLYGDEFVGIGVIDNGATKIFADFYEDDISNNTRIQYEMINQAILDTDNSYTETLLGETSPYASWFGTELYPIKIENDVDYEKLTEKLAEVKSVFIEKTIAINDTLTEAIADYNEKKETLYSDLSV